MQASLTGTAGDRSQFNYGVNTSFGESSPTTFGANASWRAPYATVGGSYTHSETSQNMSLSANGGLVVHGGGITFAPQLGDTIGIVKAKGAKGARLGSDNTSKVDGRGYVITNNLMPYRMNEVNLDPKGSSLDVELESTRQQVAPRAGAVLALEFASKSGSAMLIHAMQESGQPVPFGARVVDSEEHEVGVVGQNGQAFLLLTDSSPSNLTVAWGGGKRCALEVSTSKSSQPRDMQVVQATCREYGNK